MDPLEKKRHNNRILFVWIDGIVETRGYTTTVILHSNNKKSIPRAFNKVSEF